MTNQPVYYKILRRNPEGLLLSATDIEGIQYVPYKRTYSILKGLEKLYVLNEFELNEEIPPPYEVWGCTIGGNIIHTGHFTLCDWIQIDERIYG